RHRTRADIERVRDAFGEEPAGLDLDRRTVIGVKPRPGRSGVNAHAFPKSGKRQAAIPDHLGVAWKRKRQYAARAVRAPFERAAIAIEHDDGAFNPDARARKRSASEGGLADAGLQAVDGLQPRFTRSAGGRRDQRRKRAAANFGSARPALARD